VINDFADGKGGSADWDVACADEDEVDDDSTDDDEILGEID
jgi:hypothetical protein